MIKTYTAPITHLEDDEVFAFGANEQGFHGGGAAGYASFGATGNLWRSYNYHELPDGWKGKWNVKGKIGPQQGAEGKSFALVTVTRPGARKSIKVDFKPLFECCRRNERYRIFISFLYGIFRKYIFAYCSWAYSKIYTRKICKRSIHPWLYGKNY